MGFRFIELKKQRDQHLRAIRKRELVAPRHDLFEKYPEAYSLIFTCELQSDRKKVVAEGALVMLVAEGNEVFLWGNSSILGQLSREDADDAAKLLGDAGGACLGQVISEPDEFDTCKIKIIPINDDAVASAESEGEPGKEDDL